MRHRYYHKHLNSTLNFLVPPDKRVLFVGSFDNELPSPSSPYFTLGQKRNWQWHNIKKDLPVGHFDYIILEGALGKTSDISCFLNNLIRLCWSGTKILIYQHNYLWQGLLTFTESLNLKRKEGIYNWLSVGDIEMYLNVCGFETTRIFRKILCPVFLFGIGPIINWLSALIPLFDFLKLDQYIIARPKAELFPPSQLPQSLTVCLTVRDERDNIEPMVQTIPKLCEKQEILFIEGHSKDDTREEIERVIKAYPEKNIRVIGQPGNGQGDATRAGFLAAKGEIIIIYEGDRTCEPNDLQWFWKAMQTGRFEFIEGSRFVYPFDKKCMSLPKKCGNIFFATWFSFFLGQRVTDILSGIKAISKKDFQTLEKQWEAFGFTDPWGDFELLFGATRLGLKIGEIPIHYYPRLYGKSKMGILSHGFKVLKVAFSGYWIFRK